MRRRFFVVNREKRHIQFDRGELLKRVGMNPEFTLIGGILRFESMAAVVREQIKTEVNVAEGDLVQYVTALGAAILGRRRLEKLEKEGQAEIASR